MRTHPKILIHSKWIIVLFLILCFAFCKENKKSSFDEKIVTKIAQESTEYPSEFSSIPFFGKGLNNQVCLVYIQDLKAIYKLKYKQLSFLEFLKQSFNQQISLEYHDKIKCFNLDKKVTKSYEENDFRSFMSLYTKNAVSNRLVLKKGVSENELNTVFYYLFLNNYLVTFDDYIGNYYIYKTSFFYSK